MTLAESAGQNGLFTDGDWVETKDQDFNGTIRLTQLADIGDGIFLDKSDRYLTKETAKRLKCTFLHEGDILVSRMADPLARACIFPGDKFPCVTAVDVCIIRPDSRNVDPEWLMYQINSPQFRERAGALATGTTRKRISRKNLGGIKFSVPPLDEQRRIVDILNHASSIRRLREQAQAKAREIIPALFLDMFGDPATNPKGWKVGTVGDILKSAQYGTSTKADDGRNGVTMLRMGNVTMDGALSLRGLKYVVLGPDELEKYALEPGDILFNRTNSKELVGKTGLWDGRFSAVHASYFIRLRVDPTRATPAYVWAFFNSAFMKRRLFETARGAIGQSNINAKEVRAFPIPIPTLHLQEKFTEYLEDVQALVSVGEEARGESDAASQSLLHGCFNGTEHR